MRLSRKLYQSLFDNHGRKHDYLRISLTERCNLRCKYCMPEEGIELSKGEDCLKLPDLERLSNVFVKLCGVRKIRLTGGEPTIDGKLVPLLEKLNSLREFGLETVALTTNGLTLKRKSALYKSLGLNAVNISLDTLRKDKFAMLTRRNGWDLVYQGLIASLEAKFDSIKLNCVIQKGFNDDEVLEFAKLACIHPLEVRFIEFMPFAGNRWSNEQMVPYKELLGTLQVEFPNLKRLSPVDNEVSKVYKDPSMLGTIGFISSMSENFCSGCNRIRLTADGQLKNCLFSRHELSLRDLMRNGATDDEIAKAIASCLITKKREHGGTAYLKSTVTRPMIKIASRSFQTSAAQNQVMQDDNPDGLSFSHLNKAGQLNMVNVSSKKVIRRVAMAEGRLHVGQRIINKITANETVKKGDIITVSKVAGIMAAKSTSQLIPLCHQIPLNHVGVEIEPCQQNPGSLLIRATVEACHKTGVEMESLTAVVVTMLTLYDMCKSMNKFMVMSDVKLVSKRKEEPT